MASLVTFAPSSIEFLGHLLIDKSISRSPSKVEAIKLMPIPQSEKLLSFLGLATNVGQKFVPNFASLGALLLLISLQPLGLILLSQVTIHTDASGDGIGCCLLQNDKPVAYASRKLTSAEIRYSAIELEIFSIVYASRKFRVSSCLSNVLS